MALRAPPTPFPSETCRAPSHSRRQLLHESSRLSSPGNQSKFSVSLKSSADGLTRLPYKPLWSGKLSRAPKYSKPSSPVCLLAGGSNPERPNQGFPWEAYDVSKVSSSKEKSMEELFREQMSKQFYGGGGRKNPPRGGGGGGGRGGGGRGSEGEGGKRRYGITDEAMQVIFATIGFLFVYFYILNGVEMTRLAKDYIHFLWTGNRSVRLKKAMRKWGIFLQPLLDKKDSLNCRLKRGIFDAASWFNAHAKYRLKLRSCMTSNTDH